MAEAASLFPVLRQQVAGILTNLHQLSLLFLYNKVCGRAFLRIQRAYFSTTENAKRYGVVFRHDHSAINIALHG